MAYNSATRTFDIISDLRLQRGTTNSMVSVLGYYTPGDNGGERYYWDANSAATDDGGSIITPSVGSGNGRWKLNFTGQIRVRSFGAVGDYDNATGIGTDDTNSIKAAAAFANSTAANKIGTKPILLFEPSKSYLVTDTITLSPGVSIICDAYINYTGPTDRPVIVLGEAAVETQNITCQIKVVYRGTLDWSDSNFIGVRFINVQRSVITINYASRFCVGAEFAGDNGVSASEFGFTHNYVNLGQFIDNKYAISLRGVGPRGYCNENHWYGGNFQCTSASITSSNRYGIWVQGAGSSINQNVFHKPSFELGWSVVADQVNGEADCVLIENTAGFNTFELCRAENCSGTFIRINGGFVTGNRFYAGLSASNGIKPAIVDIGTQRGNYVLSSDDYIGNFENALIFDSGDLRTKINKYDSTRYYIRGLSFTRTNDSGIYSSGNCTLTSDYVSVTSEYLSVFVDTQLLDKITIKRDFDTGFGGRVAIACYDAAGVIIDPTVYTGTASLIAPTAQFAPGTQLGGSYVYGTDRTARQLTFYIKNETVKKIRIAITGGTAALRIRSFKIFANGGTASTAWGGLGYDSAFGIAAIKPTEIKVKGTVVYNDLSQATSPLGWINTDNGATWFPIGQSYKNYITTSIAQEDITTAYMNSTYSDTPIGGEIIFSNIIGQSTSVIVAEKLTASTWFINYALNKAP